MPARTSPTLLPHSLALCCHYPVSKCPSASIVVTSTVRVNISLTGPILSVRVTVKGSVLSPDIHDVPTLYFRIQGGCQCICSSDLDTLHEVPITAG